MPCYDPDTSSYELAEAREQLNQRTKWLCEAMTILETLPNFEIRDPELKSWWEIHKAWDKARKEAK